MALRPADWEPGKAGLSVPGPGRRTAGTSSLRPGRGWSRCSPLYSPQNRVPKGCTAEDNVPSIQERNFCGCCSGLLMASRKEGPEP
ncbi:rCG62225 [Rattus norvegicus]|uniref:RCG62225 n=1 Tax=Rattus norvegicus TaxID=10116 RepID=A6H9G0_RAT|nr:rCG62225 [Rattus norvegicus]